jgi:hypothetical protein
MFATFTEQSETLQQETKMTKREIKKATKKAKRDRDFASYAKRDAAVVALGDPLDIPPFLQISSERRKAAWREFDARRTTTGVNRND